MFKSKQKWWSRWIRVMQSWLNTGTFSSEAPYFWYAEMISHRLHSSVLGPHELVDV
jgi:hypothetical protein